jgi:Protein of unknown function (DUF429)
MSLPSPTIFGVDFSSSPNRSKPIVVASGRLALLGGRPAVCIEGLETLQSLDEFALWLERPGPWIGGFDFPFALPVEFLQSQNTQKSSWPSSSWPLHMRHLASLTRAEMVTAFKAFCDARPVGSKFAHRRCDIPAGASPSMKWVNPPVAYMLHAGAPRLLDAGVHIPLLHGGDLRRIALEAYPGHFARSIAGRQSYKSDTKAKQTAERKQMRLQILQAMEDGRNTLSLAAKLAPSVRQQCIADGSGDCLDASICLMQAAWGWQRRETNFGLPPNTESIEGWIVSVPWD